MAVSSSFCLFLGIIISMAAVSTADPSNPSIPSSYSGRCSSFVPESTPLSDSTQLDSIPSYLDISHFTGGDRLFGQRNYSFYYSGISLRLRIWPNTHPTISKEVYMIRASLNIRSPYIDYNDSPKNFSYGGSYYRRRRRPAVKFSLTGFWSEKSRKACMVGSANLKLGEGRTVNFTGALKMKYAGDENPTIHDSVVSGTFESTDSENDPGWFEPVSMFAFPVLKDYNFSLVSEAIPSLETSGFPKGGSLILKPGEFCKALSWRNIYLELLYDVECNESESQDKNCSPLGNKTGPGALPGSMNFMPIQCSEDDRKIRYVVRFSNDYAFTIESTLIADGMWDDKNDQLLIAACRILDPKDHSEGAVGGCGFRLTLRYPLVWTIKDNSGVTGELWNTSDSHFRKISVADYGNMNDIRGHQQLRYNYTMLERVHKSCPVKSPAKKGRTYPEAQSYDMRFDFSLVYSDGNKIYGGYATPLFVENESYKGNQMEAVALGPTPESVLTDVSDSDMIIATPPVTNISYRISFDSYLGFNFSLQGRVPNVFSNISLNRNRRVEVNAEGVYDSRTGQVCMVGCRKLFTSNVSEDCEILVKFEIAPLDSIKGDRIKGTIASTREKSDPLYFKDVTLSAGAFYAEIARESVWRMDLEVTLVLISNTLFCIFVGLQIFYLRRNPEVVSSISIVMVLILALGNMIPLVVNMEAVFLENHNKQTVYLSGGGWLEANEVAVRVVIMVAFLLQIRLFQLVWTAKQTESSEKSPWSGEKKASLITLPLYTLGALFAFILNWTRKQNGNRPSYSPWGDLRSFAGLILDGFLLPQVVLNAIRGSTEKALSHPFYVGTSAVRLVPHAYNQYRAHSYPASYVNGTYYYANPAADFYSTAWDVLIPLGVVAMAVIIFLQQRRGGRCILPRRFRELELYAKVPTADSSI